MDKNTHLSQFTVDSRVVDLADINQEKLKTALAQAGIERNKDLLYVDFILLNDGVNANKDEFLPSELDKSFATIKYKPINREHQETDIVGVIYDAQRVKDNDEQGNGVVAHGAVYKYRFPAVAQEIIERHQNNNLAFSMEVYFDEAQCSVCGERYEEPQHYCQHLINRSSNGASRQLIGLTFTGAAITQNPADEDAKSLAVAKKDKDEVNKADGKSTDNSNQLGDEQMSEVNIRETKEFKDALEEAVAKLDVEGRLSKAQKDLEDSQARYETLEQELETAKTEKADADKALADYKEEVAQKDRLRERMQAIAELELDFTDEELTNLGESFIKMEDSEFDSHLSVYKKMAEKVDANEEEATEEAEEAEEEEASDELAQASDEEEAEEEEDGEKLPLEDENKADASKNEDNISDILSKIV